MSEAALPRPNDEQFRWNRQWPLFAATVLVLFAAPFPPGTFGAGQPFVAIGVITLLFAAGAFCVARSHWMLTVCLLAGLASGILQGVIDFGGQRHHVLAIAFHATSIAFVVIVGFHVLRTLMQTSRVTGDTVLGGVTAYLLLGILFAYLFSLTETMAPGSFTLSEAILEADGAMTWLPVGETGGEAEAYGNNVHLLYFSFTTLTTLGYGDIAPRSNGACALTSLEAVLGQLYLAILIARLVAVAKIGRD